ncbi:hypothetical protein CK203_085878 [Vitis vinifera]|uniref:Integrase catalytic domain-containing protein n=1 Tax=Vitis vinifera TaxID=29760 RepID=A0A438DIG3_VITVI|nr:hypothetical protein CK203_085878 [Vitis vinifera]
MYLAVSEWAISAVLFRCPSPKEQKPIYYVSRALADVETDLTGRMLQWAIELSEFGIEFQPRLSMKGQSPTGEHLEQAIRLGFPASTMKQNMRHLIRIGPRLAYPFQTPGYSDSQLVVRHVQKEYEAKDARMTRYLTKVRHLTAIHRMDNRKIKRTENGRLRLGRHSCLPPIKEAILLPVHVQTNPSVVETSTCNTIEASQADGQEWTNSITEYLSEALSRRSQTGTQGRVQAARFTIIGGTCTSDPSQDPTFGPWPFAQWGMDIVGPLPAAPAQKKFLLVATDYFSKWVEAEAYASIKDKDVTNLIALRSGISVRNSYSIPRYPQSNGQAEATNKTLITALKKRLEQAKGKWVEELPGVLWAYRTTPGRPTGNTPFALAYGMDAVIPTEIGLPTIGLRQRNWMMQAWR